MREDVKKTVGGEKYPFLVFERSEMKEKKFNKFRVLSFWEGRGKTQFFFTSSLLETKIRNKRKIENSTGTVFRCGVHS